MIRAVLFDLDGTLLDTSEGIIDSVQHTITTLSLPTIPLENLLQFVDPPIQNSLIDHYGLSPDEAQNGATIFRDYYKSKALFKAAIYPGIFDLLEYLKKNGILIGVATYKREDYAIELLKHFKIADFCQVIHGADNYNKLTKADIIQLCISELHVGKENVVFVGDTEHDAKGAKDVGTKFIAVTWGFGIKKEDNLDYPFIAISNTIEQLIESINKEL